MPKLKNDTHPEILQLGAFLNNFNQESDRGAALSAAAVLEDRLEEIIKAFLIDGKSSLKLLDGFNAPIVNFSSKILLAHALGLLQDDEFQQIELLRRIRNQFAHTWEYLNFESNSIKSFSVHDKFHRTLILSGFCLLKIAKISLNSSFFPKPIKR